LGYAVSSGSHHEGDGAGTVYGFCVTILSKTHAPAAVQRAIDEFLRSVPERIRALTPEEYATSRAALVTRLLEPDRTLREAFYSMWGPVRDESLDFGIDRRHAALVAGTRQEEVAALAEAALDRAAYPRLLVHVFGNPHVGTLNEDDGSGAEAVQDWERWRAAQQTWPPVPPADPPASLVCA